MTTAAIKVTTAPPARVDRPPIVLVAHGSRDPRSARSIHALAAAVDRRWPGGARAAFLDFNPPSVPLALREAVSGGAWGPAGPAIVVPALLTRAYHSRVDVPEVVSASVVPSVVTPVLGPAGELDQPDPLLIAALAGRLSEVDVKVDAVVLAAAGTSHVAARSTVESVAHALASTLDTACKVGYATTSGPTVGEAVASLRAGGAQRVAMAAYFLAPGRLYDVAVAAAVENGAITTAEPLGGAPELVDLIVRRAAAVC